MQIDTIGLIRRSLHSDGCHFKHARSVRFGLREAGGEGRPPTSHLCVISASVPTNVSCASVVLLMPLVITSSHLLAVTLGKQTTGRMANQRQTGVSTFNGPGPNRFSQIGAGPEPVPRSVRSLPFTHALRCPALRCPALHCVALVLVELVETEKCFY